MRVIGGIVLLAGIWPLWRALTGHDVLDAGGIVMVFTGRTPGRPTAPPRRAAGRLRRAGDRDDLSARPTAAVRP